MTETSILIGEVVNKLTENQETGVMYEITSVFLEKIGFEFYSQREDTRRR